MDPGGGPVDELPRQRQQPSVKCHSAYYAAASGNLPCLCCCDGLVGQPFEKGLRILDTGLSLKEAYNTFLIDLLNQRLCQKNLDCWKTWISGEYIC